MVSQIRHDCSGDTGGTFVCLNQLATQILLSAETPEPRTMDPWRLLLVEPHTRENP